MDRRAAGAVLALAGLQPGARYVVFHCADTLERTLDNSGQYYESIDLIDAVHPQTILAYDMNGAPLPVVARRAAARCGWSASSATSMAKYVMRIEVADSFSSLGRGRGSFWADRGYEWYAGI